MNSKQAATFGSYLKRVRKEKGYSIKKLSPELDVNYSYLSKLENGHSLPSEEFLERVANVFNIDKEELMIRAGRVPDDVVKIIQSNPHEAIKYLRKQFGE